MDNTFNFTHEGNLYTVEWKESDMVLTLIFSQGGQVLKKRNVKLLGVIDESQLKQIIKDYWKSFVKNELDFLIN